MRVALEKPENGSPDSRGKGRKCIQEIGRGWQVTGWGRELRVSSGGGICHVTTPTISFFLRGSFMKKFEKTENLQYQ